MRKCKTQTTICCKVLLMLLLELAVYVLQFFVAPWVFPQYYPRSNEAAVILVLPVVAIAIIEVFFCLSKGKRWICSVVFYSLLLSIYDGYGLYGIGLSGILLDGAYPTYSKHDALLMVAAIAFIRILIHMIVSMFHCTVVACSKRIFMNNNDMKM